jgi:hypothetical protein
MENKISQVDSDRGHPPAAVILKLSFETGV